MTENTPTAATRCDWPECPGVAQDRHEIESGPELHDLCKRVLTLSAERHALAAIPVDAITDRLYSLSNDALKRIGDQCFYLITERNADGVFS